MNWNKYGANGDRLSEQENAKIELWSHTTRRIEETDNLKEIKKTAKE